MDLLHLVPYALLTVVVSWLIWPMIADPLRARFVARFHPEAPAPDGVADALFVTWADKGDPHASNGRPA